MAGKGDKDRTADKPAFDAGYDGIEWDSKRKGDKEGE